METKIRAWDGNQMLYKNIFDLNWYSTESNDANGCNTVRKMIPSDRELPTMFSTGQKDKNGKTIYQGDFDVDGICVVWCDTCNGWEFGQLDRPTNEIVIPCHCCDANFMFEDVIYDFVIYGNIYQNNK
jgi:hypothetical protein